MWGAAPRPGQLYILRMMMWDSVPRPGQKTFKKVFRHLSKFLLVIKEQQSCEKRYPWLLFSFIITKENRPQGFANIPFVNAGVTVG